MAKITIKQHDITDCGAACLASIATHYKLKLPLARIRQQAGTDKKGTNVLGLLEAAQKLGFEANICRLSRLKSQFPWIIGRLLDFSKVTNKKPLF